MPSASTTTMPSSISNQWAMVAGLLPLEKPSLMIMRKPAGMASVDEAVTTSAMPAMATRLG